MAQPKVTAPTSALELKEWVLCHDLGQLADALLVGQGLRACSRRDEVRVRQDAQDEGQGVVAARSHERLVGDHDLDDLALVET